MPDILSAVPESHRDLLRSPLTATLTTIDINGRPQSTAVWYFVDDDGQLKGSTTSDRQKYKNLRHDPNCDLFIIDPQNPFRTLEIHAEAELAADPDKATVRKFAKVYGVDEAVLVGRRGPLHLHVPTSPGGRQPAGADLMAPLVQAIVGTTRPGRSSDKPVAWLVDRLDRRLSGLKYRLGVPA